MKKTLFLSISIFIFFNACISTQALDPFSSPQKELKKEIEIPDDSPSWLNKRQIKNQITALGLSKSIGKKESDIYVQKALIGASHNLTRKIYIKTMILFKEYLEKTSNNKVFEKDIKKFSEHVALKSLTHAKVQNRWISPNNQLFIQLGVDSITVAEQIQQASKLLFEVNKNLYTNFLSNRAKKDIIKRVEENAN